jgi:hypothetical protein
LLASARETPTVVQTRHGPGWGAELWNPVTEHPAHDLKAKELVAAGWVPEEPNVRLFLTQGLLGEVIHASGAIEYTVAKIEALADAAQASYDAQFPRTPNAEFPQLGISAALHEADDAYIEYANLLTWMRALAERVSREFESDEEKTKARPITGNRERSCVEEARGWRVRAVGSDARA